MYQDHVAIEKLLGDSTRKPILVEMAVNSE